MTPKRPYLLRALYEWIVDNDLTPHLVVDATIVGTVVPQNFVSEGQIVLNISPTAVQGCNWLTMKFALTRALVDSQCR